MSLAMFMKELSIGMDETVKDLLTAHDAMKRFYKLSHKNKKCMLLDLHVYLSDKFISSRHSRLAG